MTPDDLALARRVGAIVPPGGGGRCELRGCRGYRVCSISADDVDVVIGWHQDADAAGEYTGSRWWPVRTTEWTPDLDDPATCGVLLSWLLVSYPPIADMLAKHPGTYWQSVGWILDSEGERSTTLGVALARAIIATQEQKL